jgi:hypothetical protein
MYQIVTKTSAVTSSNKPAASTWIQTPADLERNHTLDILPWFKMETYLVNFKFVFKSLGKKHDAFYFYPNELEGFIESCVLASQRSDDIIARQISIYKDVCCAMDVWANRVEEAMCWSGRNVTFNHRETVKDFEIKEAVKFGTDIDDIVRNEMATLRAAHGDYAIDQRSFRWTKMHALMMDVHF